jgi:hypothetical protein
MDDGMDGKSRERIGGEEANGYQEMENSRTAGRHLWYYKIDDEYESWQHYQCGSVQPQQLPQGAGDITLHTMGHHRDDHLTGM